MKVSGAIARPRPNCTSRFDSIVPWKSPPGFRTPDFGEAAADIAHPTAKDDIPRQHIVETRVREGQRVGISLAQAQSNAARGRLAASEVEAGRGTVDRLDGQGRAR